MKSILTKITFVTAILFMGTSCSDYLDIVPEGTPSMDNAFSNRINSFKFLYTCYSFLPSYENGNSVGFLAGDEHWLIPKGTGQIENRMGNINAWEIARGAQNSNTPYQNFWDGENGAPRLSIGIRDCNIFLENIHKPLDLQDYERQRWIGEVKFLKAFYHFYLFQLYGPIPIMDKNVPVESDINTVRRYRDPVDDVVKYICDLLDDAITTLPLQITDVAAEMGRATIPMAKAVKAQVLLLAASPLFNGNPDYVNVKDNTGTALFPANYDANKWQLAADAALDAIQAAEEASHKLYYYTSRSTNLSEATTKVLNINGAVTERWNEEIIWGSTRNVTGQGNLQTQSMGKLTNGAYYEARSVLSPTLAVAEGFYSANGVPLSEDNGEFWSENYPHRYNFQTIKDEGENKYYLEIGQETAILHFNREPRFYASLAFDRGTWYGYGYANDAQATLGKYRFRRLEVSGLKTSEDYSITGYLNKKVCSYRSSLTNNAWTAYRYAFPIIRLADVYLMYAEALNEVKPVPDAEVYRYIDLVRERAGLPGVVEAWEKYSIYPTKPATREGMRDIIRKERINELACEGKRFWDMRRWKQELSSEIRAWNIHGETPEQFYRVTVVFQRPKYTYRDYLWPLKIGSIERNPNLVQNPGWQY